MLYALHILLKFSDSDVRNDLTEILFRLLVKFNSLIFLIKTINIGRLVKDISVIVNINAEDKINTAVTDEEIMEINK